MFEIKAFKDGTRLVVVLDGVDIEKTEEELKKVFSAIKICSKSAAEPVERIKEPIPDIPEINESIDESISSNETKEDPAEKVIFLQGQFTSFTPQEIVSTPSDKLNFERFKYLKEVKNDPEYTGDIHKEITKAMVLYLRNKFKDVDEESYVSKLTSKQLKVFYDSFADCIPVKKRSAILEGTNLSWDDMLSEEEGAREIFKKMIQFFKS